MKNFVEEFDRLGKQLLNVLHQAPQRDEKVAAASRQRYLQQVDDFIARGQRVAPAATNRWAFLRQKSFATLALTSLLVLVLLISSGAGVAAAALGTLPGEALYPVKTFTEDMRLALTVSDNNEFNLLIEYVERRYDEVDALQAKGEPIPDSVAERLGEQLGTMLRTAANMDDMEMLHSLTDMHNMLQPMYQGTNGDQDRVQDQFQDKLMAQVQKTIRESWDATELGLNDPLQFRYTYSYTYQYMYKHAGENGNMQDPVGTAWGNGPLLDGTPTPAAGPSYGPGPDDGPLDSGDNDGENSYGPGVTPNPDDELPDQYYGPGGQEEEPGSGWNPSAPSTNEQEPLKKHQDQK